MYGDRLTGKLVEVGRSSHTNQHENTFALASPPNTDPSRATWAPWSVYRDTH